MMNFCTISDKNYLTQMLTMHKSLKGQNIEFRMFCLALDHETYDELAEHEHIEVIALEEVKLPHTKFTRKEACYAMSPLFTHHILNTYKSLPDVAYVDADLFFLNSPEVIFNELTQADIGIHEHRIPRYPNSGKYNVGLVYFKNNMNGLACAEFWKNCTWNKDNPYAQEYGTCHDQKYLELFEQIYDNVHVIQSHHLAAWNFKHHTYYEGKVGYKGIIDKPIFIHFSHFTWDDEGYKTQHDKEWGSPELLNDYVKGYYDEYYKAIRECESVSV